MSAGATDQNATQLAHETPAKKGSRKRKLLLFISPVIFIAAAGGLFVTGIVPGNHSHKTKAKAGTVEIPVPTYVETPEIIVNLDAGPHRISFAKVQCKFESPSAHDAAAVTAGMPRLVDMLQTYLRATRPEELRSATGVYRLREAFLSRATIAVPEGKVDDILLEEIIVQ